MAAKIDRGCSILNAADDTVNPYGLILSEKEREIIYGRLNSLETMTNAMLFGKAGWKQQAQATFCAAAEFGGLGAATIIFRHFSNISATSVFIIGIAFFVVQKLNLLLSHEDIDDTHARQNREGEKEQRERAQYFKDMGCQDISLRED